jgi:hypothetical protein
MWLPSMYVFMFSPNFCHPMWSWKCFHTCERFGYLRKVCHYYTHCIGASSHYRWQFGWCAGEPNRIWTCIIDSLCAWLHSSADWPWYVFTSPSNGSWSWQPLLQAGL